MNLPNTLTIARIIAVPIFIWAYLSGGYLFALLIFLLASFTDLLDGKIARKYNLVTNFGKIMDPLADKILVYSAFCLFIEDGTIKAWMLVLILAREFAIAGMRTVAASEGTVIAADMSGKIKTVLQMIAVCLLIFQNALLYGYMELSTPGGNLIDIVTILARIFLWGSLIMTVVSGISYIYKNKQVFSM